MSLSIIIPCLNEAAGITDLLDGLQPLRDRGAELIVVDGGSSDETPNLATGRADRVVTARRGRARQMNAGAACATGDILLFLHADTRLPENADGLITRSLHASRKVWGRFDVTIDGDHPMFGVIATLMNLRSRWTGIATGDQAIFVTRTLFEAAGGYEDIPIMEDIALSVALRRFSQPLCLRHRVVTSGRRWEKHGIFRTIWLMWRLRFAYWAGADPVDLAVRYRTHG